ncbi:hypothetical protein G7046_g1974 [Stylonectria norvegica]|nr:hypothetical protein G7046_g1974 [Stylonectria norvegica]
MVAIIKSILMALPLASALATPQLSERAAGSITFYEPGLGACGSTSTANDLIVAVSAGLFDAEKPCGRSIRVTGAAGSVDVAVVDRCAGCAYNDLDLSPAAFQRAIGDLGLGRQPGTWEWI